MYDKMAPSGLIHLQKWFGGIIGRPPTREGKIQEFTPRLAPIKTEAPLFIRPSKTMEPHQRIEIYNQQYWWRLIDCMYETFSLVVRLCSKETFNDELVIPYLDQCPPNSWSLNHLGEGFADWLEKTGKQKAADAARIDWAYHQSFLAGHFPSIREVGGDPSAWMEARLALQPHLYLLKVGYPFIKVIKGKDPLPELKAQPTLYAIYRNRHNQVNHKELEEGEWSTLQALASGKTLAQATELLDEADAESLAYWVQDWVLKDWLYGMAHKRGT